MITKDNFYDYLIYLNLFRRHIAETNHSFEAILSDTDKPNLTDFTEVKELDNGWYVRLSKKDIHNEAITKGFFTV